MVWTLVYWWLTPLWLLLGWDPLRLHQTGWQPSRRHPPTLAHARRWYADPRD